MVLEEQRTKESLQQVRLDTSDKEEETRKPDSETSELVKRVK